MWNDELPNGTVTFTLAHAKGMQGIHAPRMQLKALMSDAVLQGVCAASVQNAGHFQLATILSRPTHIALPQVCEALLCCEGVAPWLLRRRAGLRRQRNRLLAAPQRAALPGEPRRQRL